MEVIVIGLFLLGANMLYLVLRYVLALVLVQQTIVSTNIIYMLVATFLPILWWMYSTKETEFNWYNRKGATLRMVMLNGSLVLSQGVWRWFFDKVVVKLCLLPTGRNISEATIYALCRLLLLLVAGGAGFFIYFLTEKIITKPDILEAIETFRWQHIVDTRENKDRLYDLKIIRDIRTGSEVVIKEVDRFVHMFVLGNSGTGKTSSTLTPSIICDLDHKIANKQLRDKELEGMIKDGKLRVARPKEGDDVDEFALVPLEGYDKAFKNVLERNPDCGITVMCPNSALLIDVAKLAAARGLNVNLIDPMDTFDGKCVKHVGINPFILPPKLSADELQIQIASKAKQFADVILAVSELHGSSEGFWKDINTAVTSNVASVCMLGAYLNGRQTDITEIQACINEFSLLQPIVADIQEKLHMRINVQDMGGARTSAASMARREALSETKDTIRRPYEVLTPPLTDEKEIPEYYREQGYTILMYEEILKQQAINYYEPLHYVLIDPLGPGGAKMYEHATGLRNILTNNLLFDPRIKRIMSADDRHYIDWDKALARNEITLINSALELGAQGSTAIGLFIMLSMKDAIMRRPPNKRSNHFLYIDEAAQYMHPMFEDMFALYRQYKVAVCIAMQSLSQMRKTNVTKYLEGVIMGSGIHIVFGRSNADEMKYYEKLSGIENVESIQKSVSHSSQLDVNGRVMTMERNVTEQKSILEGHTIRGRDFQEVSVFMISEGRVMKGFLARVAFPKEKDYFTRKVNLVDWKKYAKFDINTLNLSLLNAENAQALDNRDNMAAYTTGITNVNIREENDPSLMPAAEQIVDKADVVVDAHGLEEIPPAPSNASPDATEDGADAQEEETIEMKKERLLRAVDVETTFALFEAKSKELLQRRAEEEARIKKEREEKEAAEEQARLEEEAKKRREEEERLMREREEEEERNNVDFGAMLTTIEGGKDDDLDVPLAKAAGAEDMFDDDSLAKRLAALNAQRREDD